MCHRKRNFSRINVFFIIELLFQIRKFFSFSKIINLCRLEMTRIRACSPTRSNWLPLRKVTASPSRLHRSNRISAATEADVPTHEPAPKSLRVFETQRTAVEQRQSSRYSNLPQFCCQRYVL